MKHYETGLIRMGKGCGKSRVFLAWLAACQLLFFAIGAQAEDGRAYLSTHSLLGAVGIKSWKTLRDERVVKQDLDDSCGAASLATLLNEHYGQNLTEQDLLQAMDTGDFLSSFEDMQRALSEFGFRAVGVSASYDQLAKLKMPVIVYTEYRRDSHFSVLRGIDEKTVWLADPSLGNRTCSRSRFFRQYRQNLALQVIPAGSRLPHGKELGPAAATGFFTKTPKRQTALAVERLEFSPMLGFGPPPL